MFLLILKKNEIEDFKRPTQISLKFDIKSLSKAQFYVIHLNKLEDFQALQA